MLEACFRFGYLTVTKTVVYELARLGILICRTRLRNLLWRMGLERVDQVLASGYQRHPASDWLPVPGDGG